MSGVLKSVTAVKKYRKKFDGCVGVSNVQLTLVNSESVY